MQKLIHDSVIAADIGKCYAFFQIARIVLTTHHLSSCKYSCCNDVPTYLSTNNMEQMMRENQYCGLFLKLVLQSSAHAYQLYDRYSSSCLHNLCSDPLGQL
jgi:hypothetical protein